MILITLQTFKLRWKFTQIKRQHHKVKKTTQQNDMISGKSYITLIVIVRIGRKFPSFVFFINFWYLLTDYLFNLSLLDLKSFQKCDRYIFCLLTRNTNQMETIISNIEKQNRAVEETLDFFVQQKIQVI